MTTALPAASFVVQELARVIKPQPELLAPVRYDVGKVTALDPFTVLVRGVSITYALRLQSYQRAAVDDLVHVLLIGSTVLVLGPTWSIDNLALAASPPPPPPPPPPKPPAQTLVTRDYAVTAWQQYRGDPAWGFPTGNRLNYGWDSPFQYRSLWLVDSGAVRAAIAGHKVHSVQLLLHNLATFRGTGTQTVVVEQHSAFSIPATWGAVPSRKAVAIWQFGVPPSNQQRWLNITSTVNLATFGGFALPDAGVTQSTTYGYCASPASSPAGQPPVLRVAWWQ